MPHFSDPPPLRVECTATVDLLSGSDIESFVNAVSANAINVSSIQGFRISARTVSQSTGDALAELVAKHVGVLNINHLELRDAEAFLGSAHRLVPAFATCTTIKHLALDGVGDLGRELLVKSRFSLVSADLTMPDPDDEFEGSDSGEDDSDEDGSDDPDDKRGVDYHTRHNPIVLLRNSRRTLVSLAGSGCNTLCAKAKTIKDLSYKHVYPHVTTLALHQCNEVPFVFRLVNAFPNLRTLDASFSLDAIMDVGETARDFQVRRRANQDKQRVFGTWKSLEACRAPSFEHCLLGLTCRVERLHILGDHVDFDMLAQVVRSTRPTRLNLDGFDVDLFRPGFAEALSQLESTEDKLQDLIIAIDLGSALRPDEIDVAKTLADMPNVLKALQLSSFSLSFNIASLHGRHRPALELVPMCAQERYLEELDLDALAARIGASVPSLLTVSIRLSGHPTRPPATATHGTEATGDHMVCESSGV